MNVYVNYNGKIMEATEPLLTAGSRGFRFGDGLFETMRLFEGDIALASYHFERLFEGMKLLGFAIPARFGAPFLLEQIVALCRKNRQGHAARVRLTVFRGEGELFEAADSMPEYIIETFPLLHSGGLNENGLALGLYKDTCKAIDRFSSIKSNNYLPYAMAARYAKKQRWNDCLILNAAGRLCESAIANVFIIKDDVIYTPGLEEGCVAGVMRRVLLERLPGFGYTVQEQMITLSMLQEAEEVFLTNAVRGIQWVGRFEERSYENKEAIRINGLLSAI